MEDLPPILDVCCGGKSFYFNPESNVLMCDMHPRVATLCDGREFTCEPEVVCDFTNLPFNDESFSLVVFDPPHLLRGKGWQAEKYGLLPNDWKPFLKKGFSECWRVLRSNGTLIFKWSDVQLALNDIRPCFPAIPLFGNRRPRSSKTHWIVFFKEGNNAN